MDTETQERLRNLPKVDAILTDRDCASLIALYGRPLVVEAIREALDHAREALQDGQIPDTPNAGSIVSAAGLRLRERARPSLRRVINATGIVLHTNLGRAPLCDEAVTAVESVARGYSNLEYDLETGERGSRQSHVDALLCELTGAEAALVVNNNAAAVMLAVNTVARDGEVVTSRGELIEIGGSFRIPDVIETSEARLVETGTTNRTRASDYARAITERTRSLLRVHPSNYRVVGFTETPTREELVALARERGLVAIEDLGSGTLEDLTQHGLAAEPTVQDAVRAGMNIVAFSGDKLLGGPQAGIAVGRADLVARMKRNPLYRALRVDKMTLTALEATLRIYLNPESVAQRVPVFQVLSQSIEMVEARARRIADVFIANACRATLVPAEGFAGGGSLPGESVPDIAVAVEREGLSAHDLHAALRRADTPIIARIADGRVLLHARTVRDDDVPLIDLSSLIP